MSMLGDNPNLCLFYLHKLKIHTLELIYVCFICFDLYCKNTEYKSEGFDNEIGEGALLM